MGPWPTDEFAYFCMTTESHSLLFDRCLDGVAEPHELRALSDLLRADQAAREQYVVTCELRQSLSDELNYPGETIFPSSVAEGAMLGAELVRPLGAELVRPLGGLPRVVSLIAALAAAGLFLAFWLGGASPSPRPVGVGAEPIASAGGPAPAPRVPSTQQPQLPTADPVQEVIDPWASPDVVARVVRKINCVWNEESWTLHNSSLIAGGETISLERGFMQIEMRNGVTAALEGPVAFTVVDPLRGSLEYGGLAVRVPEGFSGYIVDTPTAKVTDLGTEFSLRVSGNGKTDLRVIEGEVEVSKRGRDRQRVTKPQLLEKDAIWTSAHGIRAARGAPKPSDFPTAGLLADPSFDESPRLPFDEGLNLWLAADTAVRTDGKGRVVCWGDISSHSSQDRHSAWQVEPPRRPRLVDDGIGGKPAIRFDGANDALITEPFSTTNNQTVATVVRLATLLPQGGGELPGMQIINYNGPPNLVIEYRVWGKLLRTNVFAGYDGNRVVYSGRNLTKQISADQDLAIIYTYNLSKNKSALYLNGVKQSEAMAFLRVANARPKVLGQHRRLAGGALEGDIAELLIYDRAVDDDEIDSLFSYFGDRYDTPVAAPSPTSVTR